MSVGRYASRVTSSAEDIVTLGQGMWGSEMIDQSTSPGGGPNPPTYLLAAIIMMVGLHVLLPVTMLLASQWRSFGATFLAVGVVLNVWADNLFEKAGTAVRPLEPTTSLVLTGPFAISRNPMCLGMVFLLIGLAVVLGSVTPWLVIPFFIRLIARRFINPAERKLQAAFANGYVAYVTTVRRWL